MSAEEQIAGVLAEHRSVGIYARSTQCKCDHGWRSHADHDAHVAAALASATPSQLPIAPRLGVGAEGAALLPLVDAAAREAAAKAWNEGWKAAQRSPFTAPGGRPEDYNPYREEADR